jgi:hypothetical protein
MKRIENKDLSDNIFRVIKVDRRKMSISGDQDSHPSNVDLDQLVSQEKSGDGEEPFQELMG